MSLAGEKKTRLIFRLHTVIEICLNCHFLARLRRVVAQSDMFIPFKYFLYKNKPKK